MRQRSRVPAVCSMAHRIDAVMGMCLENVDAFN